MLIYWSELSVQISQHNVIRVKRTLEKVKKKLNLKKTTEHHYYGVFGVCPPHYDWFGN
jgi:hypothetical protein